MASASIPAVHNDEHHDDIVYPDAIPFIIVHLVAIVGSIWVGFTLEAVLLGVGLYIARMIAITGGFHRYFSHKSYDTSRVFQFIMAFVSQSSMQKGVLWWAAKHRHHHKHADTIEDTHSPQEHGLFFSHVGWIFSLKRGKANYDLVKDLAKYPELRWLDKHALVPPILLAFACYLIAGLPGLFVGFFLSTVFVYHGAFAINSLAHYIGKQRYLTPDDSRNSWWLALITMGEGWHNNHHYYQSSTRQGFRWYEIDVTYYVLKMLSWTGLVWNLRAPPEEVVRGERRLGSRSIETIAHQLAASFPIERISDQAREAWAQKPGLDELRGRLQEARTRAETALADMHLPVVPSFDDVKQRAQEMYVQSPSLDDVVARAREIIIESVSVRVFEDAKQAGSAG